MEFFETPTWDGDNGADNLTHDLFRPRIVSRAKVAKKRKRNKYPKASVDAEISRTLDCPNEEKLAKVKKNKAPKKRKTSDQDLVSRNKAKLQDLLKPTNEGKDQLKNSHSSLIKSPPKSSRGGNSQPDPLSCSALNSSSPSTPSKKRKKKKKKHKASTVEEDKIKMKIDHNLKKLKDKLNLSVKLDSTDNKIKEHLHSGISDPKEDRVKGIIHTKTNGNPRLTVKNLKKSSVKENENLILDKHTKKKKKEKVARVGKTSKIGAEMADYHSQNISQKQSENLTLAPDTDIHVSSHLSQPDVHGSRKSKKLKKKKKDFSKTSPKSNGKTEEGSSSHLLEMPQSAQSKKRRQAVDHEVGNKKRKISEKGCVSVEYLGSQSKNLLSEDTDVVLQQSMEPDHVGGSKNFINENTSGGPKKKLTLRDKMMEKLRGSRFRFLNEQMYNSKSEETRNFFGSDQKSFEAYHEGYKQQLMQWPVKPVDAVIKYLKKKPTNCIIADFGCGDAQIAQSLPNLVHSFDYVALNDNVTACDMAHTPLSDGSVDVAVFCLSLMGSNLSDYICEANRVLKVGGILKIAEVESRFENVEKFVRVICKYGFLCIGRDLSKDVFYIFDFKKEKNIKDGKSLPPIVLRACSYKKR